MRKRGLQVFELVLVLIDVKILEELDDLDVLEETANPLVDLE